MDGEYHENGNNINDMQYEYAWWSYKYEQIFYDDAAAPNGITWGSSMSSSGFSDWCAAQEPVFGTVKDFDLGCASINGILKARDSCSQGARTIIQEIASDCCEEKLDASCYFDCSLPCSD